MHLLSRNKQKSIAVNPEGSLFSGESQEKQKAEYLSLYLSSLPSFLGYFHSPIWIHSWLGKKGKFLFSTHD